MSHSINIFQREFSISYHQAKVIHSEKYSRNSYLQNNSFSILYHDVAFKDDKSGKEVFFTISESKLRSYVGQAVELIALDNTVIGYIDSNTNDYYYLSKTFAHDLGIIFPVSWVIFLGIVLGAICYFFNQDLFFAWGWVSIFTPLFLYLIYQQSLNIYIEKKIDKVVQNF